MAAPELLGNIGWLVFGRIRPIHTNLVIFGFAGTMLLGAAFYMVPALMRTLLFSERIGKLSSWIWNLTIIAGTITLSMGYSQSREYAEWIWPVDIAFLIAIALMFYNLFETTRRRKENVIYVTNWYVFAGVIFIFFVYFFGNAVWNPQWGAIMGGIPDGVLNWFYGHNLVGLFLTPLAIAVSYYVVPIVRRSSARGPPSKRPGALSICETGACTAIANLSGASIGDTGHPA
jgi:cbb3-type cytochrome oxidase subunit 1